ncbi:hypothetical protein [Methylobacterium thuringiense]|uniref:Uncharacterized protein n=1 Tax=Methylobacterium thuringiense TaxID=1003091 RepID=A0ABQ4TTT0_9HYPH|nr:hypothetical protein [Methylobacterium thuringiense]GJE57353.1 hypothetical protein EKPJFOCH_3867 [Methylobacterium thuringiense]
MSNALPRRRIIGAALATVAASALPASAALPTTLRGDDGDRLPDHAALWSRLPLPFSPAEAWHRLSPATQAEIGAAVIGMALAEYVYGDGMAEADQFLDDGLRSSAADVSHDLLNAIGPRLWALFPDLYGPDGDHPAWALAGGLAR